MTSPKISLIDIVSDDVNYYIEGDLDSIIEKIQSLKEIYKNRNYDSLFIELSVGVDRYDDHTVQAILYGSYLESDKQYAERTSYKKKGK
jgi:hypothetical protein